MSKKRNVLVIVGFAALLIAAGVTITTDSRPLENEIYLSLLGGDLLRQEDNAGIIVLSSPSTCELSEKHAKDFPAELKREFLSANNRDSDPIRLNSLNGLVGIVSWEDTKRLYRLRLDPSIPHGFDNHTVYALSRIGLNSEKTEAMLCLVIRGVHLEAQAIHLKKHDGNWLVHNTEILWLS